MWTSLASEHHEVSERVVCVHVYMCVCVCVWGGGGGGDSLCTELPSMHWWQGEVRRNA